MPWHVQDFVRSSRTILNCYGDMKRRVTRIYIRQFVRLFVNVPTFPLALPLTFPLAPIITRVGHLVKRFDETRFFEFFCRCSLM